MTEIDVPDWVVEAALKAWFSGEDYENADMSAFNEDMRAALTAALGALVGPLIRAAEEEAERRPLSTHKLRAALTALRQEKPE